MLSTLPQLGCVVNHFLHCIDLAIEMFFYGINKLVKLDEIEYSLVFGENLNEMVKIVREIRKRLKVREKLMDNING